MQQPQLGTEFNAVLVESIDETISTLLSRVVLDALYVHMQTNHSISRQDIPCRLDTLLTILEKIFGIPSSQTIGKAIARGFYFKLGLEFTNNPGHILIEYVDEAKMMMQKSSKLAA